MLKILRPASLLVLIGAASTAAAWYPAPYPMSPEQQQAFAEQQRQAMEQRMAAERQFMEQQAARFAPPAPWMGADYPPAPAFPAFEPPAMPEPPTMPEFGQMPERPNFDREPPAYFQERQQEMEAYREQMREQMEARRAAMQAMREQRAGAMPAYPCPGYGQGHRMHHPRMMWGEGCETGSAPQGEAQPRN